MFKDDYRKAMSFPVNEELLRQTARRMEQQKRNPRANRRNYFVPKMIATAAALCLLITELIGFAGISKGILTGFPDENETMEAADGAGAPVPNEFGVLGIEANGDEGMQARAFASPSMESSIPAAEDQAAKIVNGLPAVSATLASTSELYETYVTNNPEDLVSSNPPQVLAAELTALPVYKNLARKDESGAYYGEAVLSEDEMKSYAIKLVKIKGNDPQELEGYTTENRAQPGQPWSYTLGDVVIFANGEADISFSKDASSPSVRVSSTTPKEQLLEAASYFGSLYQSLFTLKDIAVSTYKDYFTFGQVIAYDSSGTPAEQIVSYSLNNATVGISTAQTDLEIRELDMIRIQIKPVTELVGEYPIISETEARAELLNGDYQTSLSTKAAVTESMVKSVELIYPSGDEQEYYRPYYRYLVEIEPTVSTRESIAESGKGGTEKITEGAVATYTSFYVPAVEAQYLLPATESGS